MIEKIELSILKTITYFDVFSYPITLEEIGQFASCSTTTNELEPVIKKMVKEKKIKQLKQFYYIGDDSIIERREKGNQLAAYYLEYIHRLAKRIARFPFVEAACISGSLSKNYMDSYSDIDFFVIVKPGRVLFCRILFFLLLFKKIKKRLKLHVSCVNYFIDSKTLSIPDHNIYIATEIATLIPVYNYSLYQAFINANSWINAYIATTPLKTNKYVIEKKFYFKKMLEWIFGGFIGDVLEYIYYHLTISDKVKYIPLFFWLKHRKYKNQTEGVITYKNNFLYYYNKHVFKHHPQSHLQTRVLNTYTAKLSELTNQKNTIIA